MSSNSTSTWRWLTALIVAHLVVSIVHGAAHGGAHVPMSLAGNLFIAIVIVAGPLVGLMLAWWSDRLGASVIAIAMAGALVFGGVNHFVIAGADHVTQIDGDWRWLFTITAVLLALSEALATALALELARGRKRVS
jgi:hypothetical protein